MTTPVTFKTGARPPKGAPSLKFGDFRKDMVVDGSAQAAPYPAVDYLQALQDWQVLGNDVAGDCVAVWWANSRRLVTAKLTTENYPSQDEVWKVYETQNPLFDPSDPTSFGGPNDEGMDIQTLLEYLVKTGGPDGVKAAGFAQVDHTNLEEIKAAISTGGSLVFGITVTQAQQDQFAAQQPWDFDATSPVEGGHAILVGGHTDKQTGDLNFITWGDETVLTDNFFSNAVQQAWLVIWPEHLNREEFLAEMDLAAFAAAYAEITGRPFPVSVTPDPGPTPGPVDPPPAPGPAPEPAPEPSPGPVDPPPTPGPASDPADQELAEFFQHYLAEYPFDWEAVFHLKQHALKWLRAKNLGGDRMSELEDKVAADGRREPIESTPVDPQTAHRDDQQAQLDNEREYPPSTDARTRAILDERTQRAEQVAQIQAEATNDQREREGLSRTDREAIQDEDQGKVLVTDAEHDDRFPAPGGTETGS